MPEPVQPRVIAVSGSHYQMGWQHAQQVQDLRPAILRAIEARFMQLADDRPDSAFEQIVQKTVDLLAEADPATLAFIRGLAEGLSFEYERLVRYNLVTFLRDMLTTRSALKRHNTGAGGLEGCSTWAAAGRATHDGRPILVKNRDFALEHLPVQLVVQAQPEMGYRYTYITSAGSPGVFVAGINEAGLALVDTHVSSTDVGPGLPTFALAMHILEGCHTVTQALDYLNGVPRLGRNNVLLADSEGHIALCEIGNQHIAVQMADDLLINTNHFTSATMRPFYVDTERGELRGNSYHRYRFLQDRLQQAYGQITVDFAQNLMASHGGPLESICRHPTLDSTSSTIATMIFLPAARHMLFCHGMPCSHAYTTIGYG